MTSNMISKNSELDEIILSNDGQKIKEYILDKFSKKSGPQKAVSFYISLVKLYPSMPDIVLELIDTIPSWGYWKDYFMILLYCDNDELDSYIYELLINQLNKDFNDYQQKKNISMLAKWIPRQGKSFDKKIRFVNKISQKMYPDDDIKIAKTKYRKLVSSLNKYLGTTEIFLCSKEYDKIDFDNVSSKCLYRNMKTFMNNDITKAKLQTFLFKKYVALDFKGFMDKIVFKNNSDFEKGILLSVWNINNLDYADQIDSLLNTNIKKSDVLIDTSKVMYDNKLISISIGIALLAAYFKNKIFINAYEPYQFNVGEFRLFDTIDNISNECAYSENINYTHIIETNKLSKGNNLLIVTNKPYNYKAYNFDTKICYWQLTNDSEKMKSNKPNNKLTVNIGNFYNTRIISQEKKNNNKLMIEKIIHNPDNNICHNPYFKKLLISSAAFTFSAVIYYLFG